MRRAIVAAIAVVVLLIVAVSIFALGRHSTAVGSTAPRQSPSRVLSTPPTFASTTTVAITTTTTTLPPTTTTTIPTAVVPDAVALATQCGCGAGPTALLTQAGFVSQRVAVTSDACYFTSPLTGQRAWNAAQIIGQIPNPGTVAPIGSTVDLQVCAGQVTIPVG